MYLSAERFALANQTVRETFEQCCVAWQAIPHWDTRDAGQTRVPNDIVNNPDFLPLDLKKTDFRVTVVQANAPTPDSLLAEVMAKTVELAGIVDDDVLPKLRDKAKGADLPLASAKPKPQGILDQLIPARAKVEDAGYRAPSCILTNTAGLTALTQWDSGYSVLDSLLGPANVNSLHRAKKVDKNATDNAKIRILLLGRRQRIAHGSAAEASPGEEPVDLACSVLPSLEVVGETTDSKIELSIRIRYATRIKDAGGIVVIKAP